SNSHHELRMLAEILNIPVTTSLMALGSFPGTHPQSIHMLGMHGTYEANMAMHHSDVIFAIGVRFDDRTTNNLKKYCPFANILHLDIDPTSISKTVVANIAIIGDAKKVLKKILEILKKEKEKIISRNLNPWWNTINTWRKSNNLSYDKKSIKIKPQLAIQVLWKLTKGKAYVTSDVGQHQMFTALYYLFDKPKRWINSGG
ncbi:acetolactate synthase 3 large subunit, partial [Buchnera aphidicola (Pemphigus obesinymphae)]|nr:acetolactate synthase 3 large subunit [Buchnera aphidicola (Pemphigus obesinymphae)]